MTEDELAELAGHWETNAEDRYFGRDNFGDAEFDIGRAVADAAGDVAALIAEVRRLRAALLEDFAARLYYGDLAQPTGATTWEFLPHETCMDYRQQARARFSNDMVRFLANRNHS